MATSPNGGTSQKTILVVDDDAMVLKLVSTILETKGYSVLKAGGPAEALRVESTELGEIDLLLCDVMMPEMTGVELATRITQNRPGVRVAFMSGYADGNVLFLNSGWKLMKKPFVMEGLLELVQEVLRSPPPAALDHFDTRAVKPIGS